MSAVMSLQVSVSIATIAAYHEVSYTVSPPCNG
jgi:hypothetical protein